MQEMHMCLYTTVIQHHLYRSALNIQSYEGEDHLDPSKWSSPSYDCILTRTCERVDDDRSILNGMWQRCAWLDWTCVHVLRHNSFLQEIFEGRMLGRKTRDRGRIQVLHDLIVNSDYATFRQTAAGRVAWRHSGIFSTCQKTRED